jgi:hypothetical protein
MWTFKDKEKALTAKELHNTNQDLPQAATSSPLRIGMKTDTYLDTSFLVFSL